MLLRAPGGADDGGGAAVSLTGGTVVSAADVAVASGKVVGASADVVTASIDVAGCEVAALASTDDVVTADADDVDDCRASLLGDRLVSLEHPTRATMPTQHIDAVTRSIRVRCRAIWCLCITSLDSCPAHGSMHVTV